MKARRTQEARAVEEQRCSTTKTSRRWRTRSRSTSSASTRHSKTPSPRLRGSTTRRASRSRRCSTAQRRRDRSTSIKEVVEDENQIEDPQAQWTLDQARKVDPSVEVGGTIRLDYITKEVVDVVKDPNTQIRTYEAQKIDPEVEQGDEVKIPLTKPPDELGRIAAQSAKQVLYQKVREAEREKVYNEFMDKIGELENGYVKRFERGDMIIDLNGKTEGIIPRSQQSRAERYSQGDRIKAVIVDVHTQPKGPQVVLSRTDPRLLIKLFEMEVPEIYDGTVVIKGAVREPGERAKIAVMSRERDVDPVGACVGMKGSRVQSIIRELRGEKIDIIPWQRRHRDLRPERAGSGQDHPRLA